MDTIITESTPRLDIYGIEESLKRSLQPDKTVNMKEFLKDQGCIFVEKSSRDIPEVQHEHLDRIYGDASEYVGEIIKELILPFINGQPIKDRFGKNHEARQPWKIAIKNNPFLKDAFHDEYDSKNQFKTNLITGALDGIEQLYEFAIDGTIKSSLKTIRDAVFKRLFPDAKSVADIDGLYENERSISKIKSNFPYNKMDDDQKLIEIDFLESQVLTALILLISEVQSPK